MARVMLGVLVNRGASFHPQLRRSCLFTRGRKACAAACMLHEVANVETSQVLLGKPNSACNEGQVGTWNGELACKTGLRGHLFPWCTYREQPWCAKRDVF